VDGGGRGRRASGWVLGGLLSGLLDWRWIFLVNVPLCAGAAALAPRFLREWRDPAPARPDVAGAVLATTGLGALVLALTLAETAGPLAAPTLGALVAAVTLLAGLARVEACAPDPLLDRPGCAGPAWPARSPAPASSPPPANAGPWPAGCSRSPSAPWPCGRSPPARPPCRRC
jgi:hypothetical protein